MLHPVSVLIVNDEASSLLALEAALHGVECTIVTARSGHDALQWVLAEDFALIILDVHMPIMDGFETASLIRARERSRATPIVFLTAHDPDGARVPEGYRLGAVDYIYAPVDTHVLRLKVTAFVDLFRAALARAERIAHLHQMATDELVDANGRIMLAGLAAEEQTEVQSALRGELETELGARDELIELTARQFRTPLVGIKTDAQVAMYELEVGAHRAANILGYLQDIVGNVDRLLLLTDDLTDVAAMGTGIRSLLRTD